MYNALKQQKGAKMTNRDLKILNARESGKTLRKIAEEFGISAERVKQILQRIDKAEKHRMEVMNKPYVLQGSVRLRNALREGGINDLRDLREYTERDLLKMRNLGPRSLKELYAIIDPLGISLKLTKCRTCREIEKYYIAHLQDALENINYILEHKSGDEIYESLQKHQKVLSDLIDGLKKDSSEEKF